MSNAIDIAPVISVRAPANPDSAKVKFDLLQIFRAVAALLVILYHATGIVNVDFGTPFLGDFFLMGGAGVDFFFVLSGFLITYIHYDDIGQPSKLNKYLQKRLIRIYPPYWIVTLAILPVYFLVRSFGQGDETNPGVIVGSFLLYPMYRSPILVAGWTLRHEMLFYLIFALLIGVRSKGIIIAVWVWVASLFVSAMLAFDNPLLIASPLLQTVLWPQNLEFVFGCVTARFIRASANRVSRNACFVLLVAAMAAFAVIEIVTGPMPMSIGKRVFSYGIVSSVIVTAAVMIDLTGGLSARIRNLGFYQLMLVVGEASYAIYLIHGPCLSALFKLALRLQLTKAVGVVPMAFGVMFLTMIIGLAFHLWIEKPLLSYSRGPNTARR